MNGPDLVRFLLLAASAALGIAAFLFVLRRALALAPLSRAGRALARRALPALEVALAAAALVVVVGITFGERPAFAAAALALIAGALVAAAWAPLRDVVTGVALRAEESYEPGHWIRVDDVDGRIRRVGARSLEIETDRGLRVRIPYGRLAEAPLVRAGSDVARAHAFRVTAPPDGSPAAAAAAIRAAALESFYALATREPAIRLLADDERGRTFEVTAYSVDARFFPSIEDAVRRRVGAARESG